MSHETGSPLPEHPPPGVTARQAAGIVGAVAATAGIGALATTPVLESRWYRKLKKPWWQPPGRVFGPVWTVIYALIAASMLRLRSRGGEEQRPLFVLVGTNLTLNLAWTLIFFRGRSPLAASVEIVTLEGTTVALVVRALARVSPGEPAARPLRTVARVRHRADLGDLGAELTRPIPLINRAASGGEDLGPARRCSA